MQFLPNVKIVAALVAGLLVGLNGSVGAITIAHNGDSVDIEFVDIGNVGNAADTTGYGAVNYEYSIGTYEVTSDQWANVVSFDANSNDSIHPGRKYPVGERSARGSSSRKQGAIWKYLS